jgi:hypothetical protein
MEPIFLRATSPRKNKEVATPGLAILGKVICGLIGRIRGSLVVRVGTSFFAYAFLLSTISLCRRFTGPVVTVLDGDSIEVLHHRPKRILIAQRKAKLMARRSMARALKDISCLSSSMARSPYEPDSPYHGITVSPRVG